MLANRVIFKNFNVEGGGGFMFVWKTKFSIKLGPSNTPKNIKFSESFLFANYKSIKNNLNARIMEKIIKRLKMK